MDSKDTSMRVVVAGDTVVERLIAHPRLPFVAGFDAVRPAIHIWELRPGEQHRMAVVNAGSKPYDKERPWDDYLRLPSASWHPREPMLALTVGNGVKIWSPSGLADLAPRMGEASYRWVAFSPDGESVWASPAADRDDGDGWGSSEALAVPSGSRRIGLPAWDTGVATHPGGDLVLTLVSDQGATLGVFARADRTRRDATMRLLTRALILDADGYEMPLFSSDGRYIAIRGNAYENSLQVFSFPSLREVFATTLGSPSPGYPYPEDWLAEMRSWSRHNVAFATRSGIRLFVGTPDGRILELDLESGVSAEHRLPGGRRVTALTVTADGDLLVATEGGEVLLLSGVGGGAPAEAADRRTAATVSASFLDTVSEVPDGADVEEALETTDGRRTWTAGQLEEVTESSESDPVWLRMRATINAFMSDRTDRGSD